VALWLDAINVPSENLLRNMHNNPLRRLLPLIAQQLHSGGNHYFLLVRCGRFFFVATFSFLLLASFSVRRQQIAGEPGSGRRMIF
jgi:hypothetical protein